MKRHIAILSGLFFIGSLLLAADNKPGSSKPGKWLTVTVTAADGNPGTFRYLEKKPKNWKSAPLSEEISISWKYAGSEPDDETKKHMTELERALGDLYSSDDSCLTLVRTMGGVQEWCFYAKDYGAFMKTLNARLAGKPHFPISITHSHDSGWKYWKSYTDRLQKQKDDSG